jgi:O-succinylbenzoate synthase
MRVTRADLYELRLPLAEPFIISGGAMAERRSLIVRLRDETGATGFGEAPPFELPFYSEETLAGATDLLARVLLPRVTGRDFASPEAVDAALREGVRGNPFARAAIETAVWDLEADRHGTGLAALLSERLRVPAAETVSCGVALGIPPDRQPATLSHRVERALREGYRRVKIKVMPGWDTVAVRAAREAMGGVDLPLTVDANGAYAWPGHERQLRHLDDAGLLYIEQPLAPDELVGHARLRHLLRTPICLDETLRSASLARQVLALDGPLVWNIKVHRVGGLSEVCRIYRLAAHCGVTLWAGTMPESGIGSLAPLAVAALPQCRYPSDLEPSARWYGVGRDVVELAMRPDGRMAVPSAGVRAQLDPARFEGATRRIATLP